MTETGPPALDPDIEAYYESKAEAARLEDRAGRLELLRTRALLRRHLPPAPARVLDVGGAAGVHAAWLADEGYDVHLVDPVALHVEQARRTAGRGAMFTAAVGDARALAESDASVDAVLLLGPLYHLPDRPDRVRALSEAARVVRPGGMVAAAAISRFASLFDGLARGFLVEDTGFRSLVERDLATGEHHNPDRRPGLFTTAYFHHPDELRSEATSAGLAVRELVGLEGMAGWLPHVVDRLDDPEVLDVALFAATAVEAEPALAGLSAHLLLIGERPA